MIAGLVQILLFQGLGELVSKFALPLIPGPVVGLLLLLAWLQLRRGVSPEMATVSTALTQHLGLLFVPAAVGVVVFWPHLRANALAVIVTLAASVILTIAVAALTLRLLSGAGNDEG